MSVPTKTVLVFMVSSTVLFSFPPQARAKFPQKNRVVHKEKVPGQSRSRYGGTLVWGTTNPPTMINPVLTQHSVSAALIPLIFNGLVRINADGKVEPDLAESWDISEDKRTYAFHLRRGVTFHDGVECTADDVKFTYERIVDPAVNSVFKSHFDLVAGFEVADRYTFRVILREPFAPLLYKLERYVMPRHLLEGEDLAGSSFNFHPVGTGPFKFKSWDRKTGRIELAANPDYFEGRPYLDRIVVKVYPDNSQLWAALMRQEADFVKYLNYEDYLILENDPAFKAYKIPWEMYCAVVYNPQDSVWFDRELRKAVAYGIDVKALMAVVSGEGIVSTGPFHPKSMGFNPGVRPLEYNPVRARMTLMHRGWRDVDGDGIFEKGGRKLEIRLLVDARSGYYTEMATLIRQQLSEAGIKVNVLLYEDESELTEEYLRTQKPQAWLRFFVGYGFGKFDGYDISRNWYSLSSESNKLWNYRDEEVDRLFEAGRVEEDEKKRAAIYREIHRMVYEDQPACFLFFPVSFHAVSAKVENTDGFFNCHMPDYTIKDWYINTNALSNVSLRVPPLTGRSSLFRRP